MSQFPASGGDDDGTFDDDSYDDDRCCFADDDLWSDVVRAFGDNMSDNIEEMSAMRCSILRDAVTSADEYCVMEALLEVTFSLSN